MRVTRLVALVAAVALVGSEGAQAKPLRAHGPGLAHARHASLRAPENIRRPRIIGVVKVGSELRTDHGRWTSRPSHYRYRWSLCRSRARHHRCKRIKGARRPTYRVLRRDVGRILRVTVTARNAHGAATVRSTTATITLAPHAKSRPTGQPVNLTRPAISGSPVVGEVLTASPGSWGNAPTAFAYQWQDCSRSGGSCTNISVASSDTYAVGAGDQHATIRVTVTATNASGSASAGSAATGQVQAVSSTAPVNSAAPTISGNPQVGSTLNAARGSWSDSPTSYSYQWEGCATTGASCTAISGATSTSYTLKSADAVHTIRVSVTASNAAGSTGASSAPTGVVTPSTPSMPVNTSAPLISGVAAMGDTLSATSGTWANTPMGYAYQWQDCNSSGASCVNVAGAGGSADYIVQASDAGQTLVVVVTASNNAGSVAQASAPTSPVSSGSTVGIAGDLFVSARAAPNGDGSQAAPFQTITQCAAVVTAGHTCWIEAGTYADKNVCPVVGGTSATNMVTFENYPGESPVMNGGGASADAFVCANRNHIRVSGMTITNYDPPNEVGADGSGAITFGNSVGPEVDHNTISNIAASGNQDAGIFIYNTSTTQSPFTILDNQVSNVSETGVTNGEQDAIWVAAGDDYSGGLIQGNVVTGAGKDGIRLECGTHTSTLTVQDNIATHNTADGIDVNNCYATANVLVQNNFIGWTTNENLIAKHSQNVAFLNNTSVQPTTGVTNCGGFKCLNASDGMEILGEVGFDSTGGFGTVDGGNWNLTVENNVFYGGNGLQIGAGDYAVIGTSNGVINYDDWYGWSNYMFYTDQHVLGDGGFDFFISLPLFTLSTGFEANGLASDPLFTDARAGNYTLQASSPLVGTSSTGGNLGADPSQLAGVGPTASQGLSNTGT